MAEFFLVGEVSFLFLPSSVASFVPSLFAWDHYSDAIPNNMLYVVIR